MDDGTFDDLRLRLVMQLKDHVRPSRQAPAGAAKAWMTSTPFYDQAYCSRSGRGDIHVCGSLGLGLGAHTQEELRAHTAERLANSETLKNLSNTSKPRKELFESLRREVECVAPTNRRRT